jgi:hypothetical protein
VCWTILRFKPLRILDTTQISNQKLNPFLAFQFSENKKNDALGFGNLNYRGSISRSILTGKQSRLESKFDPQLAIQWQNRR